MKATAVVDNTFLDYVLSIEDETERTSLFQFWAIVYNKPITLVILDDEIYSVQLENSSMNILPVDGGEFMVLSLPEVGKYFHIVRCGDDDVENAECIIADNIYNNRLRFIAHIASEE